jgi:electron transfer flavoprotein beta subunit
MKILVCIKQVPDMESKFKLNGEGNWYDGSDLAWRMNEYDEYAVEQAVQLKDQLGDAELTVLSIGPERVKEMMKKALAMGCDRGAHVADDESFKKDPYEIASVIAEFAKDKGFDLIFTGMQSQDRGSGRKKAVVKARTPALVTCQLGLNTPRYPTLPNIMKAKKKELLSIPVSELLKVEAKQETARMYFPEKKGGGLVLEGSVGDLVDQLIKILKDKTAVLA